MDQRARACHALLVQDEQVAVPGTLHHARQVLGAQALVLQSKACQNCRWELFFLRVFCFWNRWPYYAVTVDIDLGEREREMQWLRCTHKCIQSWTMKKHAAVTPRNSEDARMNICKVTAVTPRKLEDVRTYKVSAARKKISHYTRIPSPLIWTLWGSFSFIGVTTKDTFCKKGFGDFEGHKHAG